MSNEKQKATDGAEPVPHIGQPEVRPVADFRSNYGSESNPFDYAVDIPHYSFLTLDGSVVPFEVADTASSAQMSLGESFIYRSNEGWNTTINELLRKQGVAAIEERVPVVAYGANQNPKTLIEKFKVEGREDLAIVPTLEASMSNYMAAGHQKPGRRGNVFAELAHVEDVQSEVKVVFLTHEQLALLNKGESTYDVGVLKDSSITLEDGHELPAIIYAGDHSIYLDENGQPVPYSSLRVGGPGAEGLKPMSSEEMLQDMLSVPGVVEAINELAPEFDQIIKTYGDNITGAYAELMGGRQDSIDQRKPIQDAITAVLREAGRVGSVSTSDKIHVLSRSMLDTWPTVADIEAGWEAHESGHTDPGQAYSLGRMSVQHFNDKGGRGNSVVEAALTASARYYSEENHRNKLGNGKSVEQVEASAETDITAAEVLERLGSALDEGTIDFIRENVPLVSDPDKLLEDVFDDVVSAMEVLIEMGEIEGDPFVILAELGFLEG